MTDNEALLEYIEMSGYPEGVSRERALFAYYQLVADQAVLLRLVELGTVTEDELAMLQFTIGG